MSDHGATVAATQPPPLSNRIRGLYGFGAAAYGVKDNGFSYFLLFYYNQALGLPAVYGGTAMLIAMVFDAISDPLVGVWSDNTHSRWGRRHPFMYGAAIPVALCYFLLWNPPISHLSEFGLFVYLTVVAVLVRFFITLYEIPSTSIVAELTEQYDERTRLLGLRYMWGWFGGLAMAALNWGFFMSVWGVNNPETYRLYGTVGALVMLVAIVASAGGLHGHIPYLKPPPVRTSMRPGRLLRDLGVTLANRNFMALFSAGLFAALGAGVSTSFNTYINTHFWEFAPEQVRWIVLSLFASAFIAPPLARAITRRLDKKRSAMLVYGISIFWGAAPFVLRLLEWFPPNHHPALFPMILVHAVIDVVLIIMFGTIQSSMLADIVEENEERTGRREEGLFFAARTFAAKFTSGVGAFVAGVILTVIHFPRGAQPGTVEPEVIFNLGLVYGPALMVFYLAALICIAFYGITRDGHDGRVARLSALGPARFSGRS